MQPLAYLDHYTETGLWQKLTRFAKRAGQEVAHKALCLYYASLSAETPVWAKGVILGALGYFILPADAIPDLIPLAGFTDDLGMLATAFFTVAAHIKPEHKQRADETLSQWFGT